MQACVRHARLFLARRARGAVVPNLSLQLLSISEGAAAMQNTAPSTQFLISLLPLCSSFHPMWGRRPPGSPPALAAAVSPSCSLYTCICFRMPSYPATPAPLLRRARRAGGRPH